MGLKSGLRLRALLEKGNQFLAHFLAHKLLIGCKKFLSVKVTTLVLYLTITPEWEFGTKPRTTLSLMMIYGNTGMVSVSTHLPALQPSWH